MKQPELRPGKFSDKHDAEIGGAKTTDDLLARIAPIVIQGQVAGPPSLVSASDGYGFVAVDIGAFAVAGTVHALTAKESDDTLAVGSAGDVMLVEVPSGGGRADWPAIRRLSGRAAACVARLLSPAM